MLLSSMVGRVLDVVDQLSGLVLGIECRKSAIRLEWLISIVPFVDVEAWRVTVMILKNIDQ